MKPLIDWDVLMELSRPPMPPRRETGPGNMWDDNADMYRQMAAMEAEYTEHMLSLLPVTKADTVLDVGCGPGRITVPMARRAASVTAIDAAEKMLAHCRANVAAAGLTNVDARFLDWKEAVAGENLERHDIVIASRSVGLYDLKKLTSFAKKYVVTSCWANGPSIPELLDQLFAGTSDRPPMLMREDRRLGYNIAFNVAYDLGYDPNLHLVPDGFRRVFPNQAAAYEELSALRPLDRDKWGRFTENVDRFLTETDNGVVFEMKTRTYLMWWEAPQE